MHFLTNFSGLNNVPCFLFFVAVVVVFPKLHSCQLLLVNLFLFLTKNTLIHGHRALAIITAVLAAAAAAVVVVVVYHGVAAMMTMVK